MRNEKRGTSNEEKYVLTQRTAEKDVLVFNLDFQIVFVLGSLFFVLKK